jgi:hypothetical protein
LAAITSLLFAFCRFMPSFRPGGYNNFDAWIQILHFAFADLGENRYPAILLGEHSRDALSARTCFAHSFYSQRENLWRPPVTCGGSRRFFAFACRRESPVLFALASTNWQQELAGLEVASVRITADGGKEAASCYQSPVRLRFYRLDFQRQDWVKDAKEDALVTVRTGEGTHAYLRARR